MVHNINAGAQYRYNYSYVYQCWHISVLHKVVKSSSVESSGLLIIHCHTLQLLRYSSIITSFLHAWRRVAPREIFKYSRSVFAWTTISRGVEHTRLVYHHAWLLHSRLLHAWPLHACLLHTLLAITRVAGVILLKLFFEKLFHLARYNSGLFSPGQIFNNAFEAKLLHQIVNGTFAHFNILLF